MAFTSERVDANLRPLYWSALFKAMRQNIFNCSGLAELESFLEKPRRMAAHRSIADLLGDAHLTKSKPNTSANQREQMSMF